MRPKLSIDTSLYIKSPFLRRLYRLIQWPVESVLAIHAVNRIYESGRGLDLEGFCDSVMRDCGVSLAPEPALLSRIKAVTGPLVIMANHPFGGVEGVAMAGFVHRARPDFKMLANSLLLAFEPLAPIVIPVNPFGGANAATQNLGPMKAALKQLKAGGAILVFPAGEVSVWQASEGRVADYPWSPSVARLARMTQATVLPVHIAGQNSVFFLAVARLSRSLKTMLLARETVHRRAGALQIRIGEPLAPAGYASYTDDLELAAYFRSRCYALGTS